MTVERGPADCEPAAAGGRGGGERSTRDGHRLRRIARRRFETAPGGQRTLPPDKARSVAPWRRFAITQTAPGRGGGTDKTTRAQTRTRRPGEGRRVLFCRGRGAACTAADSHAPARGERLAGLPQQHAEPRLECTAGAGLVEPAGHVRGDPGGLLRIAVSTPRAPTMGMTSRP
ncbi:hypothetical protein DM52_1277 [Burkholderia mallei]|nr:hypothetical protein DM52_1277 [Burkholderia mallei]